MIKLCHNSTPPRPDQNHLPNTHPPHQTQASKRTPRYGPSDARRHFVLLLGHLCNHLTALASSRRIAFLLSLALSRFLPETGVIIMNVTPRYKYIFCALFSFYYSSATANNLVEVYLNAHGTPSTRCPSSCHHQSRENIAWHQLRSNCSQDSSQVTGSAKKQSPGLRR